MHHARREIQVLLCGNPKHILNDAGMECASSRAGSQHIPHTQKEYFGLLAGNNVAKQLLAGNCRIVFCKNLSFSHMTENMAVSPVKIDDDIHAQYWNGETNIYYELRDCVMRGMLDGTPFALDSRDDARFTIKRT